MENPKTSETDWRQHLHSLPSGEKPFPKFVVWIFLIPFLVIVGGIVLLVCGGFLGLTFGVGPEDGGGVIYTLFGLIANLAIGFAIAFFGRRRGHSRVACRVAFFSFTATAFLIILHDAWRFLSR
jgi:hypothetical protein